MEKITQKIKKELKKNFPKQKFSVRSKISGFSETIWVRWTDGTAAEKVEKIIKKYEDLSRDEISGEILLGGNTFVFAGREISDESKKKIEKMIDEKYDPNCYNNDKKSYAYDELFWKIEKQTDF